MKLLPFPDISVKSIYDLTPELFLSRGIRLLLLDVDNTLSPYSVNTPTPKMKAWADKMKSSGIEPVLLSNNRGERPAVFAAALGVDYQKKALKPFTGAARRVLREKHVPASETAVVGDQIYTDILCAVRLGATSVLVQPISLKNPLLFLRYLLELPFRR